MAKDIASSAVDGGLLLIGIAEDKSTGEFSLTRGPVLGMQERIELVARSFLQPPIDIRTTVITRAEDSNQGVPRR